MSSVGQLKVSKAHPFITDNLNPGEFSTASGPTANERKLPDFNSKWLIVQFIWVQLFWVVEDRKRHYKGQERSNVH